MLLALLSINLFANEEKYIINKITYNIQGPTKPFFLERKYGIKEGMEFDTLEDVENYRADIEQELHNLRYYEELSVVTSVSDNNVELIINLDEAWNIIPFPYMKWDTNNGGRIASKLFWNNTFGTLTDTFFQLGVNIGQNPEEDLELQKWDFIAKVSDVYIGGRYYNLGFSQKRDNEARGDEKWQFYSTELSIGTTFYPHPKFAYSPKITAEFNYLYDDFHGTIKEEDIEEKPLIISYDHGFGDSDIDWYGNFRDGYSYSFGNTISLLVDGSASPSTSFDISGAYYKTFGDLPISFAAKAYAVKSLNEELLGLGSNVRGVQDADMYGETGAFFNTNVFISVIRLKGIAEAIFAPCFDIGYTDNSGLDYGTGADFILYIDKLKSLVARGTIAFDPRDDFSGMSLGNFTDYIEIEITSSLYF